MPICTDAGCGQPDIEQPVELFMKGNRLCSMCQACRDRKNTYKNAARRVNEVQLTWWPSIKSPRRRAQLRRWAKAVMGY